MPTTNRKTKGSATPAPQGPDPGGDRAQRLNRAIAARGLCSRRKADEYILAGKVLVNGIPEANPGRRVAPGDNVVVDGTALPAPEAPVHLMLHKPVHVVCTVSDPQGRATVLDCLPEDRRSVRLFPVGRLDYFSEGLLLLTNDGELAQRLAHPSHHQARVYEAVVRGKVEERALDAMRGGMTLKEGERLLPVEVRRTGMRNGDTLLSLTLRQGVNRQIRRMCRDLGLTVLRLVRVAMGPLELGTLAPGQARDLTQAELDALSGTAGPSRRQGAAPPGKGQRTRKR